MNKKEETFNEDMFANNVGLVGNKSIDWIDKYMKNGFDGLPQDPDFIKNAMKMVGFSIKMIHMSQIKTRTDKSFALRLAQHLPDEETKLAYIKLTNPEVAPLLKGRPTK
ncbi:MAG TPA: hypothetical protein VMW95_00710 [Desulfobacterales bacterium]|nr:hypothetical protein [Desulfobacterales bacterium]